MEHRPCQGRSCARVHTQTAEKLLAARVIQTFTPTERRLQPANGEHPVPKTLRTAARDATVRKMTTGRRKSRHARMHVHRQPPLTLHMSPSLQLGPGSMDFRRGLECYASYCQSKDGRTSLTYLPARPYQETGKRRREEEEEGKTTQGILSATWLQASSCVSTRATRPRDVHSSHILSSTLGGKAPRQHTNIL